MSMAMTQHPACPILLAEEHALFAMKCAKCGERSSSHICEQVKIGALPGGRRLTREQACAKSKLIIRVHRTKHSWNLRVRACRICGEHRIRIRVELAR